MASQSPLGVGVDDAPVTLPRLDLCPEEDKKVQSALPLKAPAQEECHVHEDDDDDDDDDYSLKKTKEMDASSSTSAHSVPPPERRRPHRRRFSLSSFSSSLFCLRRRGSRVHFAGWCFFFNGEDTVLT